MASSQSSPFDDEERPSGSVRPLSQADLQAILAHLNEDSEELLAGTSGDQPVVALRVRLGGWHARGHGSRLGAAVPAQPGRRRVAAGSGGGARTARLLAPLE